MNTHSHFFIPCAAICVISSVATAGDWVTFENQTNLRMLSDDLSATINCVNEKEYAVGDLNKDGRTDVVVFRKQPFTTAGLRRNVLFMNEGTAEGHSIEGVLVDRTAELAPAMLDETNDRGVVIADVTGDGWPDVITATTLSGSHGKAISHPRVYVNLGEDEDGNWLGLDFDDVDRIPTMPVEPRFCWVSAGDVNGSGDLDLYFVDYDSGPYSRGGDLDDRLLINDGTGYFSDESSTRMTSQMLSSGFGLAGDMMDMNGNGLLDIIKAQAGSVRISYNNPANEGFFNSTHTPYGGAAYHNTVGDLNNDGLPDMVVTDDGTDRYLLNQGPNGQGQAQFNQFTLPEQSTSFGGTGFGGNSVIADLNNDGWNDIIITDCDVDIPGCSRFSNIYRSNGNGQNVSFARDLGNIPMNMLQGVHDMAVLDINGDGWLDLVVGRCSGTQVWIQVPPTPPCPGDIDGSGSVDGSDLAMLLSLWGSGSGHGDLDGSGVVDGSDLAILLANWGSCPE